MSSTQLSFRPASFSLAARRRCVTALVVFGAGLLGSGCADDEGKGTLIVPVVLGPDRDCDEVGVEEIQISLGEDGEYSNLVGCSDERPRTVRIEKVPAGKYELLVEGKDDDFVSVMDNLADPVSDRRVEVLGDGASVEASQVTLTASPAIFELTVDFRASSCSASGIRSFEVRAFDDQVDQLLQYELECDDDTLGTSLIPDESRSLKGDQFADFTIQPLDKSGQAVGAPLGPDMPFEPPGAGRTVSVTLLDCDENGCPDIDIDIDGF